MSFIKLFLTRNPFFVKGFSSFIKPPANPTMSESFPTKLPKEDLEKLMNPTGFLDPKDYKDYEGIDPKGKIVQKPSQKDSPKEINTKEYGFKVKGPEPTRFGDWERKGRVSDF